MGRWIFCPYCLETVYTGNIRWLWFFVHLLIGYLPLYLLYCLLSKGRICPLCKKRVYGGDLD